MLGIPSIITMDLAVHLEKVFELGRECRVLIENKDLETNECREILEVQVS